MDGGGGDGWRRSGPLPATRWRESTKVSGRILSSRKCARNDAAYSTHLGTSFSATPHSTTHPRTHEAHTHDAESGEGVKKSAPRQEECGRRERRGSRGHVWLTHTLVAWCGADTLVTWHHTMSRVSLPRCLTRKVFDSMSSPGKSRV